MDLILTLVLALGWFALWFGVGWWAYLKANGR
jgi:hypothetical protein